MNFWETLDSWADNDLTDLLHDHVDNHATMLSECEAFEHWTRVDENYGFWTPDSKKNHIKGIAPNIAKSSPHGPWDRWFAMPTEEDFPTLHKYLYSHSEYKNPIISKLGPGAQLAPHSHPKQKMLYNMSINYPEGCQFAVYPTGLIPYKAGDVYKIKVQQEHAVYNRSNSDRYHVQIADVADMSRIFR